jgi:hypothetical protein
LERESFYKEKIIYQTKTPQVQGFSFSFFWGGDFSAALLLKKNLKAHFSSYFVLFIPRSV